MSFHAQQAKFKRLFQESAAWRLLRADNAPYILAFVAELFAESSEVPYSRARVLLDSEIERSRDLGVWQTETAALSYLNLWIKNGWLREMDGLLSKTDAMETALRFAHGLDERSTGATASHLRIVQDAVRDFAVSVSRDQPARLAMLQQKQAETQAEIDRVKAGLWDALDENQQRERIREIHQLSMQLTGDFRYFEDEIRRLDKTLRVQMMAHEATRGEVLQQLMAQEDLLAQTEAGSAFNGFFELLGDVNRATEFRAQLRTVLESGAVQYLSHKQQHDLQRLVPTLVAESERVFRIRRRTEQELRSYIESGVALEEGAIRQLIARLEQSAMLLLEQGADLNAATGLSLPTGALSFASPERLRLKHPDDDFQAADTQEHTNSREAGSAVLASLETVRTKELTQSMRRILQQHGPLTLAGIAAHAPLRMGVEELVACFRVARAVGAAELPEQESLWVWDRQGRLIRARLPVLLLNARLFPDDIDTLSL
ncbi:hypothetical protein L1281_000658 [Neisseria sp. HSC-16F19]|nr:DUF3375 domain-containing protein [Neisseria sp. HSC-16F19]MCP2040078.1 hypothetical protein [Neisseria sp. HSC-16F19]